MLMSQSAPTSVDTQQPGADQRRKRLSRLGHQGDHAEEQGRRCLLPPVQHVVLVHQVGDDQVEQLAGALSEHSVTEGEKRRGRIL